MKKFNLEVRGKSGRLWNIYTDCESHDQAVEIFEDVGVLPEVYEIVGEEDFEINKRMN